MRCKHCGMCDTLVHSITLLLSSQLVNHHKIRYPCVNTSLLLLSVLLLGRANIVSLQHCAESM